MQVFTITVYLLIVTTEVLSFWQEKGSDFDYTQGNIFLSLLGNLIFFYSIATLWSKKHMIKKVLGKHRSILLFFTLLFLSCFWSDFPSIALKRFFKIFIMYSLLLSAIVSEQGSKIIEKSINYYILIVVILSVIFIVFLPSYGWMIYDDGSYLPKGIFVHKNSLGIFGAIASLWLFNRWLQDYKRIPWLLGVCISFLCISKSTTSIIGFILASAVIVFSICLKRFENKLKVVILFSIFSTLLCCFIYLVSIDISFNSLFLGLVGKDFTFTGRTNIWPVLINIGLTNHPYFGSGYGVFFMGSETSWITRILRWEANTAHNGFLQVFLENGIIGLFTLIFIFIRTLINAIRIKDALLIGLLSLVLCFNIFEAGLFRPVFAFFIFLFVYAKVYITKDINV